MIGLGMGGGAAVDAFRSGSAESIPASGGSGPGLVQGVD